MNTSKNTMNIPLVIYDYRVLCFLIMSTIDGNEMQTAEELILNGHYSNKIEELESNPALRPYLDREELVQYIKCCWAIVLNRGPNACPYQPHTAVVVDDDGKTTPYWRKQIFPTYKGNRSKKPELVLSVGQIGLQYVNAPKSTFHYFSCPGYEADDFAGAFVYLKRLNQKLPGGKPELGDREIWLYTVDSDWMQLVGDGVTWYNTGPWEPRIRGPIETAGWALKRLKVHISHPSQIVDTKMKQGDKSDNLPPNTPRYMIDLMVGHPEYHLRHNLPIWRQLELTLGSTEVNQNLIHWGTAKRWIMRRGYRLPV